MNLKNYENMDPHLLVGLVNTELRNNAISLEDLVKTHDLDEKKLRLCLESEGYIYLEKVKQFR